jgi:CMP-N-acetylneuraminic acid synthetase
MSDEPATMNVLGITPARGGSKGIPKKNIKKIAGKPLIAWTIVPVKESKMLDRYVVSTEDEEIAQIVRGYGVEVLHRPSSLATDEASTLSVIQNAINDITCDIVILFQATSPIRRSGLIEECIREFIDNDYDSLATGFICTYIEYGKKELRRQDIQGFFYDDGNVYVIKADLINKGDCYVKKIDRKIISRWENHGTY